MALMDLKRVKDKVAWVLEKKPHTREDDTLLVISVWKRFYREEFHDLVFREFSRPDLPSFESIRRARQKFNEEGLYLPSEEVMKRRGRKIPEVQEDLREFNNDNQ